MTNEDADKIAEILRDHSAAKSDRMLFEEQWNEIAERVLPRTGRFGSEAEQIRPGEKRTELMYDSTAALALRHFQAAFGSMTIPQGQRWQRFVTGDPYLDKQPAVRAYMDDVADVLFRMRGNWRSGFGAQMSECFASYGAYGSACLLVNEAIGRRVQYMHHPINRVYFFTDAAGMVDKVHLMHEKTARQVRQMFGKLPKDLESLAEREPEKKVRLIQCIKPRQDRDPRQANAQNMRFASYWIAETQQQIIEEGGFRSMPAACGRFYTGTGEIYGRSPAMDVLPDIKMLNRMERANINGAEMAAFPPILLPEDGFLEGFSLKPAALNYGGMGDDGRPMAQGLQTGARLDIGVDYSNSKREAINLAMYVTLFQIMVDAPQMTATEVLQRAQEKGVLLAPTMGRVQTEQLGAMTERELDIAFQADLLPDMPDELIEAGGRIQIEYDAPLNRALKAEEGLNTLRWVESIVPMMEIDPKVRNVPKFAEIARGMAEVYSVPQRYMNTEEDIEAMNEQVNQQAQMQSLLAAAPVAADAAESLANAQAKSATVVA